MLLCYLAYQHDVLSVAVTHMLVNVMLNDSPTAAAYQQSSF